MSGEVGNIHLTIDNLKATGLTCESKCCIPVRSKPSGCVTIKWVKEGASPEWKETVKLVYLTKNSTISFEMFDKGLVHRHSYGIVQKTVPELLAAPRLDIPFPPHTAVLSITVKEQNTDSAASDNLDAAKKAAHGLTEAPDTPAVNGSPYAPLGEVATSLAKLMDIVDAFAEIHPYVKVAWCIVSAVYKVIKDQLERDDGIRHLFEIMAALYSQRVLLRAREKEMNKTVADIMQRILKQTIECTLFIQEYSGQGFAGRAFKYSLSTTADTRITEFKEAFTKLRGDLDTGLITQTALISLRLVRGVEITTIKSRLEPAVIEWTDRPICHPRTRVDIQSDITKWILDPNGTNVLWLIGQVGAGKSTLATTIASMYAKTRRLGAFVFFDRDVEERRNPTKFVRTLAYELSKFDQCISEKISGVIDDHAHVAQASLDDQFQHLIGTPLQDTTSEGKPLATQGPIVIIIDSLDECGNESTRKQLLKVLATQTKNLPQVVRIIITSRPEPDIHAQFDKQKHIEPLEVLPSDTAVRVYMESQLKVIAEEKGLGDNWPDDVKLTPLVSLASGLFIWASTACKYIGSYKPKVALDNLLREGVLKGLDGLYAKALEHAGDWSEATLQQDFQSIIGTISVAKYPMTTKAIDKFLELEKGSSKELLSRFASVIHQADKEPVRFFHKSFSDFITESPNHFDGNKQSPAGNPSWFINVSHHEHRAALNCITQMDKAFKLAPTIKPEADYDEVVRYSCSYWIL